MHQSILLQHSSGSRWNTGLIDSIYDNTTLIENSSMQHILVVVKCMTLQYSSVRHYSLQHSSDTQYSSVVVTQHLKTVFNCNIALVDISSLQHTFEKQYFIATHCRKTVFHCMYLYTNNAWEAIFSSIIRTVGRAHSQTKWKIKKNIFFNPKFSKSLS